MKSDPSELRGGSSRHSLAKSAVGSLVLSAAVVAGVLAVSYPVAAALVGGGVLAAGDVARRTVGLLRERRREGRAQRVCLEYLDVCVQV